MFIHLVGYLKNDLIVWYRPKLGRLPIRRDIAEKDD
jgi:hypothetical protein